MAILENQRHELFAQGVASGMTLVDAYVAAGYKKNDSASARLYGDVRIQGRVQEIKQAGAERAEIDRAFVLNLVQDIIEEARESGQYGPAMTGAVKLGVDIGMFEQRSTVTSRKEPVDMSDDELAKVISEASTENRTVN